jgi:hypothetical protein
MQKCGNSKMQNCGTTELWNCGTGEQWINGKQKSEEGTRKIQDTLFELRSRAMDRTEWEDIAETTEAIHSESSPHLLNFKLEESFFSGNKMKTSKIRKGRKKTHVERPFAAFRKLINLGKWDSHTTLPDISKNVYFS